MATNTTKTITISRTNQPLIDIDREYNFNTNQLKELNTYISWGEFVPGHDLYVQEYDADGNLLPVTKAYSGVRSIFNKYSSVFKSKEVRIGDNVPLIDTPSTRREIKSKSDCRISNLVNESRNGGRLGYETYDYSDFAYCKNLGKMSNNYMITLRRFPMPVGDIISYPGITGKGKQLHIAPSVGCLVSWMGTSGNDLSSILSYSVEMPFESKTAEMQMETNDPSSSKLNQFFSLFNPRYQKEVAKGQANMDTNFLPNWMKKRVDFSNAPYSDQLTKTDQNKIYGPIDSIKDTHMRSDKGIKLEQSFSLTFEYELRAYSNINTRQAMLDLLSNILAVCYTTGDFWGGGRTWMGAANSDIFSNLKIMGASNVTEFADKFMEDINSVTSNIKSSVKEQGGIWETIKKFANNFGGMLLGGVLNKLGRPQKTMMNSLLSSAPVGLWHVTIGNPFHPIMSIGNMILTKTTITHTGPLGLDDFPTGLKVTCELTRGRSRDRREIEQMYMHGMNRIYQDVGKNLEDMIKKAPTYKANQNAAKSSPATSSQQTDISATDSQSIENNTKEPNVLPGSNAYLRYWNTSIPEYTLLTGQEIVNGSQKKKKESK